ncbi:DUF2127 domain-containing protein [Actinomadura parmotrematis]|uniref:DUF2127 domain-containing protein n=1 Tax=Actinomadura parmotrematis TaxID=2864039 RepID=A0ABS7FTZ6_9ACTN|nr:DUF2127 domain-containing protein [Actinomadura parmotrematis]MBW8483862.1 DUF2127 domain-containing protein [Actinomadura parmotrematis]
MDWSLLTCARKGHVTYAPDEAALRDRLHTASPVGEAWRCLRCGTYVLGAPHRTGPAGEAPLVPRGRALRDAFIMRFFAVERAIRGLLVLAAAYGVWRFAESRGSIQRVFEDEIPLLRPIARQVGWDLDHSKIIESARHVFDMRASTLRWLAVALVVYAAIEIIEAVGLWLLKRWGEYFAVVATCFGLPVEIYELAERVTVLRVGALLLNVGLVVYIVVTKRLFGVRGGRAAHEAHLRSESLLEVEHATHDADLRHHRDAPREPQTDPAR